MKAIFVIVLLLSTWRYANADNPKQEFTDPTGDRWWQVSPKDFMPAFDATKLTIERLAPETIRFTFTMAATFPKDLPQDQTVMFRLYLDLDSNIKTGQDWSHVGKQIGSDLDVTLMWHNGKWLIMPEEIAEHVAHDIKDNTVSMTVTDPRFAKEQFNMFAWINGLKENMDVMPNDGFYDVSLPIKP